MELLRSEMDWVVLFFRKQEATWRMRAEAFKAITEEVISAGQVSYALRKSAMWSRLAGDASNRFKEVRAGL